MAWYVFALVDDMAAGKPGTGLSGPLGIRRIGSILAVVERRADVPPAEFGTLQRHQAVVTELASRVPAILPVRFGTLLDTDALEEVLGERAEDVAEGFDLVRDRVQFTWRRTQVRSTKTEVRSTKTEVRSTKTEVRSTKTEVRSTKAEVRSTKAEVRSTKRTTATELSGGEYLRQAARAAKPAPPAGWRAIRSKLAGLVVAERYQPASATAPESLYHLVGRTETQRYRLLADRLASSSASVTVTGPFPPFAFTPELL